MNDTKAPQRTCKGCEMRHFNCHSTCEIYAEFKQRNEEVNKQRAAAVDLTEFDMTRLQKVIKYNQKYHKRFR